MKFFFTSSLVYRLMIASFSLAEYFVGSATKLYIDQWRNSKRETKYYKPNQNMQESDQQKSRNKLNLSLVPHHRIQGWTHNAREFQREIVFWPILMPPLAPPKGTSTTAHLNVISAARAIVSSASTFGAIRIPPFTATSFSISLNFMAENDSMAHAHNGRWFKISRSRILVPGRRWWECCAL